MWNRSEVICARSKVVVGSHGGRGWLFQVRCVTEAGSSEIVEQDGFSLDTEKPEWLTMVHWER